MPLNIADYMDSPNSLENGLSKIDVTLLKDLPLTVIINGSLFNNLVSAMPSYEDILSFNFTCKLLIKL